MLNRLKQKIKRRVRNYIIGVSREQIKRPVVLANPTIKIGERVTLSDSTVFNNHITVGDNCFLDNVTIGSYSYLSFNVSVSNTTVGKFCSIAQGVGICLGTHPSDTFVSTSPVFFSTSQQCGTTFADTQYFKEAGSCTIGNDVWIGANAIIMNDVSIGDGAIIGAGSIVTKDVPPYAIVVGVPGKIIKYRFEQEEIDFLLEFKWWNKDENWIKANFKSFHDIKSFKAHFGS